VILAWILIITFGSGVLAWVLGSFSRIIARIVCFVGLAIDAAIVLYLWISRYGVLKSSGQTWIAEIQTEWIRPLGISFHLAMDGLSLLLVALTVVLGAASVAASWKEINHKVGTFHFALMSALTGILGVFTAIDLFLFYFFWELMLVPVFFLILAWGQENRTPSAVKFFIYTQAGGLFMLLSIVAVYWIGGRDTGQYTFDYAKILNVSMAGNFAVALGFFAAFAVKLPMVPLHLWLPDAYTQAPTGGSVILAGLLSKTAAYGMLRFLFPLFPESAGQMSFVVSILAVIGILYGAMMAFSQSNIKRLIAYTGVSHLGFVLLGIFAGTQMALQGAVVVMLAHGLSTGSLFIITGALRQRIGTDDMAKMSGLWSALPRMGSITLFFALASLGLPGLANFIGEFLVLAGTFGVHPWLTGIATFVLVVSTIYVTWIIYQVFYGPVKQQWNISDLCFGEVLNLSVMVTAILWIGIFPQTVLNTAKGALERIQNAKSTVARQGSVATNKYMNMTTSETETGGKLTEYEVNNVRP
jgi:NADH-quinone oxidoreductase subunit M